MKIIRSLLIVLLILTTAFTFSSCKKSGEDANGFTWTYKGKTYKADIAEMHFDNTTAMGSHIFATVNGGSGLLFQVYPVIAGTYSFKPSGNNTLTFTDPEGYQLTGTGTLYITYAEGNSASGNFSGTVTDGVAATPISGSFTNIKLGR